VHKIGRCFCCNW